MTARPLPDHGFDEPEEVTKPDNTAAFKPTAKGRPYSDVVEVIHLRRPPKGARIAEASAWGAEAWSMARDILRAWKKRRGPREVLAVVRFEDGRGIEKRISLDHPRGWK